MGDFVGLHQVAIGTHDLDASIVFYRDILQLAFIERFDPPGIAFFRIGDVRLLIEQGAPASLLYYKVDDIHAASAALRSRGVVFDQEPHLIHRDESGQFGTPGEEEWMGFFKDPAGNTVAIAARLPSP